MKESLNTDEVLSDLFAEKTPDHLIEQQFIQSQREDLLERFPGKYTRRFSSLDVLSNFNPLTLIYPQAFKSHGSGTFPALEVSYHWGRAVDNIVDGDASLPEEFSSVSDWLSRQKELVSSGAEAVDDQPTVEYMLKRTLLRLREMGSGVDIQVEALKFLDAMEKEYERRVERKVLTRKELELLNGDSFGPPHTITLVGIRSRAKGEDIWELGQIQGRIQALRDIQTELENGICNIPSKVLEESGTSFFSLENNSLLFDDNQTLQAWKEKELVECDVLLQQLMAKKLDLPARFYVGYIASEINRHIENLK